jgi:pimeloyl-ACP methyl ester carboxylesterase
MRFRRAGTTAAAAVSLIVGLLAAPSVIAVDAADAAKPRPSSADDGWVSFRLPYLDRSDGDPNRLNLARHATKPGPLLLFLPATGAVPSDYRDFLETASEEGYSVLGLDYWNVGRSVTRTCGADPDCYTQLQRNRLTGKSPSQFSRVDAANSILMRLKNALRYLNRHDPAGHWERYLGGSAIRWDRIVLAGHSQGGGESAYIAHFHRVKGVLMFSAPVVTFGDVVASWIDGDGETPVSRMYGFDSTKDIYFGRIVGSWRELGMGSASAASATDVPTGGHALLSSLYLGSPLESHGRTVNDNTIRDSDGVPVLQETWSWMLGQVR